ncbi:HypC/HybG/HupF family hydrogenase formation chaperone [Ostreiculturibacter nitratireducens]|uniref:HypC/HybG/HupF family hydrogenase formation chaperone n=1 Tax=Ostreiculturibacter nitratireducens TaxID=3075226 RepID=UPI0031B5A640
MCLGIPGRIVAVTDAGRQMALADISGVRREVSLACVGGEDPEAVVGRWVLIHVGFAMALIDEDEAQRTLEALRRMGEEAEALDAMAESARALEAGE